MKFGFVLPNNWGLADVGDVVRFAPMAEDRGFDSVWVNHHVLNVGYIADRLDTGPYYDALTILTWAAASTERVKLGTSVLVLPYLHPMVLAKELATLDRLSGGRVIAGVGVGSLPEENALLGVPYDSRGADADEMIDVMTALWSSPRASHSGRRFALDEVANGPQPQQDPLPLWVGGTGAPARRRAARVGHGWHPMCSVSGLARRLPELDEALAAERRDRSSMVVAPRIASTALPDAAAVEAWAEAGADQLIVGTTSSDPGEIEGELDRLASLLPPKF